MPPRTITEKIIAAHALEGPIGPGQIATVTPDVLLLNDVSGPLAFDQFAAMGATAPADPDRVVLVADHFAPASDINSATSIKSLRSFARAHGIKVRPACSYVSGYMRRHPETRDLLEPH